MIELIIIISLSVSISKKAKEKGLSAAKYILIFIALWLGLQFLGAFIGVMIFPDNIFGAYILGLIGGILGAIIGYQIANNASPASKPISNDDVIDSEL
ncbi:MAG: hypothetical protein AAFX87_01920 [Bacteroidota bacterium]